MNVTCMLSVFLKLHLSVLIAGFTGLFGRLVSLDAFWIVFFRMLIGGAFVLAYFILLLPISLIAAFAERRLRYAQFGR